MTQARNLSRLLNKKLQTYKFTATSGQTSFADSDDGGNILSYTPDNMLVTYNGVVLENGSEYTATNGTSVVLDTGADSAAEVNVYAFESVSLGGYLASDKGIDDNASSTALTIDASGNVLVTKTASSISTTGVQLNAEGSLSAVKAGTTSYFNRLTTDGEITRFLKDGSTVGSIYNGGGNLGVNSSGGLLLIDDIITPTSGADATHDIGRPSARYKDLYLSGGAYLGGTGAANYLDDYEEGLHTVVLSATTGTPSASSNEDTISYTKVGDTVFINGQIGGVSCSGCSGTLYISMPFVTKTLNERADYYFAIGGTGVSSVSYFQVTQAGGGSSNFTLTAIKPDGTRDSLVATLFSSAGSFDINLAGFIYKTT